MHIKQRIMTMSAVLTTMAIAIGGLVGVPSVIAIKKSVEEISAAQAKLDDQYAINRYLSKAAEDIAARKKRVAPLAAASIREVGELEFVTAMETAADSTGVEQRLVIETANLREVNEWERIVPVSIFVTGEYRDTLAFLRAVERMPYLVDVTSASVSPGGALRMSDRPGNAQLEIHALVFWIGKAAPDFVTGVPSVISPATPTEGQDEQENQ